ncbi:heat shock 70 kDa protein 14 isoform X2 [Poeciliopsis prolifica]|uniref:heat shock 70 kDa protein 14 isoform X2 n=1 Tax=Poeciliopsis prolifica TaxID=188132 RepID=UPI002414465A|nr:heat shock 70 kDa protein 14 isoform X2 [Poeciliopsis prolifica]
MFSSMSAIGIHFGYTCACVAVFKDGRADVVANDAGDRVTPAVVGYRDTEQIVGIAAKQGQVRNAANTVVKVKQVLGRRFDDPVTQMHKAETKCKVINREQMPCYEIICGEHTELVAPEDVAKLIFKKMKETAQSALGSDVTDTVITVPFEFAHSQKRSLREAAEAAGFHVLRMIHEPAAALLAYNVGQDYSSGNSHVLVYKLGGTSLSVTVLQVNGGMLRVVSTRTDHSIGGESFTQALAQHLASEFRRARFELLCSTLFNKSIQPIRSLLDEAGLCAGDINKVVLCGGSSRIPRLQQMIREMFLGVELLNSAPPDEMIAVGAAMEAGLLVGRDGLAPEEESVAVDVSAADILLKEVDESGAQTFSILLPVGTPLPARRHHTFSAEGRLSSLCLEVYQKIAMQQPQKLSKIILRDLQPSEDDHNINAVVTMKRDGSVHVSCEVQSSGKSEAVTIAAAS